MKKVIEIKGRPYVCTLSDGSTLRLLSGDNREIEDKQISESLYQAQKSGLVMILDIDVPLPQDGVEVDKKESKKVTQTKKSVNKEVE